MENLVNMDISVLVLTYNSNFEKLLKTVNSIIDQKDVTFELIISDDGSSQFYKQELINFLNFKNFKNFKIIQLEKNKGTVYNSLFGIEKCQGKYLKCIAPGDYLYDDKTLSFFVKYMETNALDFCAGKTLYYEIVNSEISFVNRTNNMTYNQFLDLKNKEDIAKSYILNQNSIPAPSYVFTKTLYHEYLLKIVNKIKYCEDFSFYLMIADGKMPTIIDRPIVYYDCNGGISTSANADIKLRNDRKKIIKILCKNYNYLQGAKQMWKKEISLKHIFVRKAKNKIKKLLNK